MKLSSEVDNVALESARQQMVILQRQIYSRNEDLKLYRDLLQDNDSPSGVSISDFSLTLLDDDRIKFGFLLKRISLKKLHRELIKHFYQELLIQVSNIKQEKV